MKYLFPLLLCLCWAGAPIYAQQPALTIAAKAYYLVDFQTGQALAGQNVNERI